METTSEKAERLVRLIDRESEYSLLTLQQGSALQVLRKEVIASAWFADLVAVIVAADLRDIGEENGRMNGYRLETLARLLSLFGVGSTVNGRVRRSELVELFANAKG